MACKGGGLHAIMIGVSDFVYVANAAVLDDPPFADKLVSHLTTVPKE